MFTVRRTDIFKDWLDGLKDRRAAARIRARLLRLEDGNLGDVKPVGGGVSELRIDYGPGYRVYFTRNLNGRSSCSSAAARRRGRAVTSPRRNGLPKS